MHMLCFVKARDMCSYESPLTYLTAVPKSFDSRRAPQDKLLELVLIRKKISFNIIFQKPVQFLLLLIFLIKILNNIKMFSMTEDFNL